LKFGVLTYVLVLTFQVHTLRRNQRQGSQRPKESLPIEVQDSLKPTRSSDRRRGKQKNPSSSSTEDLRVTLEAAAVAAKAAADAAESAALSVARNTEVIDFIVKSMKSSKKRQKTKNAAAADEKKAIVRSNQVTQWILGFMAVTTIAWRFGVVKVVKGVTNKLNDPLGYVGKLVGGNDEEPKEKTVEKSSEKGSLLEKISHVDLPSILQKDSDPKDTKSEEKLVENSAEKGNLLHKLPHVDLPSLLQNDSDHKATKSAAEKKGQETKSFLAKSAAAVDVKTKEAGKEAEKTAFSFANLFAVKSKEK